MSKLYRIGIYPSGSAASGAAFMRLCAVAMLLFVFASAAAAQSGVVDLDFNFNGGEQGWVAGFSDYPGGSDTEYHLWAGMRYMPRKVTYIPKRGFYIQGINPSADLFMFLKRRLAPADGIIAGQAYRIEYVITFASNAPTGCLGIGSPPGEGVTLKAGGSTVEPRALALPNGEIGMNVDKGNQSQGGTAASAAGDIANGVPCEEAGPPFQYASVVRTHTHTSNVTASQDGDLWLLIGTDSGYEGMTGLYYESIRVKLTPI